MKTNRLPPHTHTMNTTTIQLPEPELGYIQTDKSNQPAFSARQMREAMGHATQAEVTDVVIDKIAPQLDPVGDEHPAEWDIWKDSERICAELRDILAPQPAQAITHDVWVKHPYTVALMEQVKDLSSKVAAQATQAEVTDELLHPEDFNVEVIRKQMGGFDPVRTQGVRVTHKPTGISVTCDAARSQHTNRHQALEQLRAILALRPQPAQATQAGVTDADIDAVTIQQWGDQRGAPLQAHRAYARAILALRPAAVPMNQDEVIAAIKSANISSSTTFWSIFEAGIRAAEAHHGITAQAKKETP